MSTNPVVGEEHKLNIVDQIIPACVNLLLNHDDNAIRQNVNQITNTGLFYLANVVLKHLDSSINLDSSAKAVVVEGTLKQIIHAAGLDDPQQIQELEEYISDHVIEACKALGRLTDTFIIESAECISDKIIRCIKCGFACIKAKLTCSCCTRKDKSS